MKKWLVVPAMSLGFLTACWMASAQPGSQEKASPAPSEPKRLSVESDDPDMRAMEQSLEQMSRDIDHMVRGIEAQSQRWAQQGDHWAHYGDRWARQGKRWA